MNDMNLQEIFEFTLKNAPANILYRMKRDILGEPADSDEMTALREKILALPQVKKALGCQREDGFIGTVLHGCYFGGFDSTVDLLKRNGVETSHPALVKARDCLIHWTDYESDHFYKAGNAMDEHGRGGFRSVVTRVLLDLDADESVPLIQDQISLALDAFRGALAHRSVDDFSKKATFRGQPCRYYIKGAPFPDASHVDILQRTLSWRTEDNTAMVEKAYRHCADLMKDYDGGQIYVNCGHFVGPFNYNWRAAQPIDSSAVYHISLRDFDSHPIDFAWFMKGLSWVGRKYPIVREAPVNGYTDALASLLTDDFVNQVSPEQLRNCKNYASVAPSWRKKEHMAADLYFPVLLELSRHGVTFE